MTKSDNRRPAVRLIAFIFASIVLGALLSPVLFKAGHAGAGLIDQFRLGDTPPFGYLRKVAVESDFKRYFNRALMIGVLVCLWPFAKMLNIRKSDFAMGKNAHWLGDLTIGFALSAGLLLLMGLGLAGAGLYEFKEEIRWGKSIGRAASTGAGVALVEEFLFRGALFALLLRSMRETPALWVLSIFFAVVHFLKPPDGIRIAPEDVTWTSGFWMAGKIFQGFGNPVFLLAEFATLLAVGLILGRARLRTGSLWLPIGLHGGWVFGIFLFRGLADGTKATRNGEYLPWIGENLKTGLLPLAVISVTALALRWILDRRGARAART